MSLLTGLFRLTVPELPVADEVIVTDATVDPGSLYRIVGTDAALTILMRTRPITALSGTRFAVKIYQPAPTPPGGTLTIVVPAGQQIEGDDGSWGVAIEYGGQWLGMYREWLCDDAGRWMRVGGIG